MEVPLEHIEIKIQPELAEVVLKNGLSKEYTCWLIAKELDKMMGESGGKINKNKLSLKLQEITNVTRFTIVRYLEKGENVFWRFNKKRDVIYLSSFIKVCMALDVNYVYSMNIIHDLSLINELKSFSYCKRILLSAVASKTGKPVSNINLATRCGICKRSVRNYLDTAEDLQISQRIKNFEALKSFNNKEEAKSFLPILSKNDHLQIGSLRIRMYDNKYWILKQIPNSIINKTGRSSVRNSKRELRKESGHPFIQKQKKIYTEQDTEIDGLVHLCYLHEMDDILYNTGVPNIRIFIRRGNDNGFISV